MDATLDTLLSFGAPSDATATDYISFVEQSYGLAAPLVLQRYPLSAFGSSPYPAFSALELVHTEATYLCPAHRGLNVTVQHGIPAFTYLWSHVPSCPWTPQIAQAGEDALQSLGATHTSEIPFVFGNVDNLPMPNGTCNFTLAEKQLSVDLVSAWSAMAEQGNPSSGNLQWPAYNPSTSLGINIDNSSNVGIVNYTACDFWDAIDAAVLRNATISNAQADNNITNSSSATNGSTISSRAPSGNITTFEGRASTLVGDFALLIEIMLAVRILSSFV